MRFCSRTLAAALACLTAFASTADMRALDAQPEVEYGDGYKTWTAPKDAKLWRLETLLYELRHEDKTWRNATSESVGIRKKTNQEKTLEALGIPAVRVGRSMQHPAIEEPIEVVTRRLGFEWRKHAVVSFPSYGRHSWFVVLFFQDSHDQAYWRPYQIFMFDTHPERGFNIDWPDILDDTIYFMAVRHARQANPKAKIQALSIFKYDEKRMRLTWQENDFHWQAGKFAGNPTWTRQNLEFGNQRIEREVIQTQYLFTEEEEFLKYKDEEPYRVLRGKEFFSWNPLGFSFYHPADELAKLRDNKLPEIRRQAARRLGLILNESHRILERALRNDKDAYVRMQAALALEAIGDTSALKAVERGLRDFDEPDNVRQALERAHATLTAIKSGEKKSIKRGEPKERKSRSALSLPLTEGEGPKLSEETR